MLNPEKFGFTTTAAHEEILKAMRLAGVDVEDGDSVIETYLVSLIFFFKGLKDEGRCEGEINHFVDWLAENIKHNVNPPSDKRSLRP